MARRSAPPLGLPAGKAGPKECPWPKKSRGAAAGFDGADDPLLSAGALRRDSDAGRRSDQQLELERNPISLRLSRRLVVVGALGWRSRAWRFNLESSIARRVSRR